MIKNPHLKCQEKDDFQEAHPSTDNQLAAGDRVRVSDTEESDTDDEKGDSDYKSAEVEDGVDRDEGDGVDGGDGVNEGDGGNERDGVDEEEDVNEVEAVNLQAEEEIPRTTRSGRTVKTPSRFTF